MNAIGFSTGAVARGDVRAGVAAIASCMEADAVELSALRLDELEPLMEVVPELDLRQFRHVSVHAPSRFPAEEEGRVVEILSSLPSEWPIVLHPDSVHEISCWSALAARLLIENMDSRKRTGRTPEELQPFFAALPNARFCLDVAHARDVGGTQQIGALLDAYGGRLAQLHVSSVGSGGEHTTLDEASMHDYRSIAAGISGSVALVIESVLTPDEIPEELRRVRRLFASE